ncbi:YitT family protein [Paenibacillus sp. Marseille-Q4541]|uniref:YitT family protein n=1 Tax=Paenibacillus sp. Marseille-Q4541 TaxID=2831522 RepID=UPI001BA51C2D|nr:YitT family protein [Paenibacillus sp. Marseille-Q4541]
MNQPPHSIQSPSVKPSIKIWMKKLLLVILGGILASIGLELFLHPNQLIVGGVTGISAMFAYQTEMRLGLFLFLFNLPFILLSYRRVQRQYAILTVLGLVVLSLSSLMLHSLPALIEHPLLAAAGGGLFLGIGIGMVLYEGGTLDTLAIRPVDHAKVNGSRNKYRLERIIMVVNLLVLTAAGITFGAEQAMYSIVAYLIAFEGVHFSLRGFTFNRKICIVSVEKQRIEQSIKTRLYREPESHHQIMEIPGQSTDEIEQLPVLYYKIHLFESRRVKSIVRSVDPHASILFDTDMDTVVEHTSD